LAQGKLQQSLATHFYIEAAMRFHPLLRLLLCLVCACSVDGATLNGQKNTGSLSPITRVVEMLKALLEKTEEEHKVLMFWPSTLVL